MFRRKKDYVSHKYYFNQAILTKFKAYKDIKKSNEELKNLLLSYLSNFSPSASLCCELGNILNAEGKIEPAKFWFESALRIAKKEPEDHVEYNEFCPCYGLAYCYFCLGEIEKALEFSTRAIRVYPANKVAQKYHKMYYDEYIKRIKEKEIEKY